jgi:inner membrane protein
MSTSLEPEVRYRGIYKTAVYKSTSDITGNFEMPFEASDLEGSIDWEKAVVTFGITDNRGIREGVEILWNNQKLEPESGMVNKEIAKTGFSMSAYRLDQDALNSRAFHFP